MLILAIRHYPELCRKLNTNFVTGTGKNRRTIQLDHIYDALGPEKAAALPTLHALSENDNTGSFAGKRKHAFWKAFQAARCSTLTAMASLGTTTELSRPAATLRQEEPVASSFFLIRLDNIGLQYMPKCGLIQKKSKFALLQSLESEKAFSSSGFVP